MNKSHTVAFTKFTVILITILGAYIRIRSLSDFYLSPDDTLHLLIAKVPLSQIFALNNTDTDPPLIYYLLHFFVNYPSYVRYISLLPGILVIPSAFFLGKKFFNTSSGLFLAFAVAFGLAPVLLSQTVRHYSLFLFFFSWALYFWQSWKNNQSQVSLYLYSLFTFFSMITHYLALIPQIFIFFISLIQLQKQLRLRWVLAQAPAFLILVVCLFFQGINMWFTSSPYHQGATTQWLVYGYPNTLLDYLDRLFGILASYSYPELNILTIVFLLFSAGCYLSLRSKNYSLPGIFILSICAHIILVRFHLYPLLGSRYYLHLLLPFLLICSVPINLLETRLSPRWHFLFPVFFCFFSLISFFIYTQNRFFRYDNPVSSMEFPVTLAQKNDFFHFLDHELQPADVIIADRATGMYFLISDSRYQSKQLTVPVGITVYRHHPVCFHNHTLALYLNEDFLRQLVSTCPTTPGSRYFITALGWDLPTLYQLANSSQLQQFVLSRHFQISAGGMSQIYVVDAIALKEFLKIHTPSPL